MAMSEKKIGRMVTADVDKALANIDASTPKPEMGTSDELKKATGPSRNLTRGEAFKLARMKAKLAGKDPSKATFTWGGKTYHTRTAEEESRMRRAATPRAGNAPAGAANKPAGAANKPAGAANKPAGAANKPAGAANKPAVTVNKPAAAAAKPAVRTGIAQASRTAPAAKPTPKIQAAPVRQQKPDWAKGLKSAPPAMLQRKEEPKPKPGSLLMRRQEEKPKPGSLLMKKAKGGKIDGAALRGKTRAMKKGK